MKKQPMISVIVPVFNVEKYLKRCIESILGQTYRNLEVILVDDGSMDRCPQICDEYASKDVRIKVIHQKNGGLSSARNRGLDISSGEFIGFVDSDDYIYADMYESLLAKMQESGADIVVCGVADEYEDVAEGLHSDTYYVKQETEVSGRTALQYILEDRILVSHAWDKLYKRELWENIRFPIGKRFEDMYTTYLTIAKAEKVLMIPDKKYVYIHRSGSTSYTKMLNNCFDIFGAYCEWVSFAERNMPDMLPVVLEKAVVMGTDTYNMALRKINNEDVSINVGQIAAFLKKWEKDLLKSTNITKKYKIFCKGIIHIPVFYKILYTCLVKLKNFFDKETKSS